MVQQRQYYRSVRILQASESINVVTFIVKIIFVAKYVSNIDDLAGTVAIYLGCDISYSKRTWANFQSPIGQTDNNKIKHLAENHNKENHLQWNVLSRNMPEKL